jgi:dTDP-glucose 4,6-dehydratase
VARGIVFVLEHGEDGPYHLVGEREVDNAQMLEQIAGIIGKSASYQLVNFHSSRPGHDLRYALADNRLRALGWTIPQTFEESLTRTVRWYLEHREWL